MPFSSEVVDVGTMLAVSEHIDANLIEHLVAEVRRVLRPGGVYVMTTPASWTESLLKLLARLGMVSHEELDEHKRQYRPADIRLIFVKSGFDRDQVQLGYFEAGMNIWAKAVK